MGGKTRVSDLLGPVDIACVVGPYDSFFNAKFSRMLTSQQMVAANDILNKRNEISLGSNKFFLVGLRSEMVASTYISNFFSDLSTVNENSPTTLICVDGDGFVSPEKFNEIAVLKLMKGM